MVSQAYAVFKGLRVCISALNIKKRILTTGCLVGIIWMNANAIYGTDLRIRAQDDETLGGLKLTFRIPDKVEDGPKGAGIEVVSEANKQALRDQDGSFVEYWNVDLEGKKIPGLVIQRGLSPKEGSWPPSAETKFKVTTADGERYENLSIYSSKPPSSSTYFAKYQNYYYPITRYDMRPSSPTPKLIYPSIKTSPYGRLGTIALEAIPVELMPFFDSVSIFGAVWYVFDMYTKDVSELGDSRLKSKWDKRGVTQIYPSMTEEKYNSLLKQRLGKNYEYFLGNAFYLPVENLHFLCFFPFSKGSSKNTGQSTDIVMHETGHNVLYILRPDLRGTRSVSYDVAAFDESFGDLTTFFALASIKEVVKRIIGLTGGNLETSSFFSVLGETLANRRDAASKTNPSQMPSCEEHDYSERFTRAIYGTLVDVFNLKKRLKSSHTTSEEQMLINTAGSLRKLFLKSVITIPVEDFNFANFGRLLETVAMQDPETSYFSGYVFRNFAKQGIDLNNMLWSAICVPESSSETKTIGTKRINWVCSSSLEPKRDAVRSFRSLIISAAAAAASSTISDDDSSSDSDSTSDDDPY